MRTRSPIRALAAALVTLTAVGATTVTARAEDHDHPSIVLDVGHVDAIDVVDEAGQLVLKVHDDTHLHDPGSVSHDPADVLFHVKPEAEFVVPEGLPASYDFIGDAGDTVWLLPQTQNDNPDVVWMGWASQRLGTGVTAGNMTLTMVGVDGPGDVLLFQNDAFGAPINKWGQGAGFPTSIPLAQNAHVHSNWVFTAEGEYEITFRVSGTTPGGQPISSDDTVYHVAVGELPEEEPAPALSISGLASSYDVGDPVSLTAVQDPPTSQDHYHWFVKPAGAADYSVVPGEAGGSYAFTATESHNGAQVVVKLYDHDHAVIAESPPVTLSVGGGAPTPDLSQTITASLDEADGALLVSVDPDDRQVQLTPLELTGNASAFTATGDLRPVRVIDTRSAAPGWSVAGQSSDFTDGAAGTISSSGLGWAPIVTDQAPNQGAVAGSGVAPGDGLGTSRTLASAPSGSGRGTATLGAGLDLEAPTETEPGTYTALLTLTAI